MRFVFIAIFLTLVYKTIKVSLQLTYQFEVCKEFPYYS